MHLRTMHSKHTAAQMFLKCLSSMEGHGQHELFVHSLVLVRLKDCSWQLFFFLPFFTLWRLFVQQRQSPRKHLSKVWEAKKFSAATSKEFLSSTQDQHSSVKHSRFCVVSFPNWSWDQPLNMKSTSLSFEEAGGDFLTCRVSLTSVKLSMVSNCQNKDFIERKRCAKTSQPKGRPLSCCVCWSSNTARPTAAEQLGLVILMSMGAHIPQWHSKHAACLCALCKRYSEDDLRTTQSQPEIARVKCFFHRN